MIIYFSAEGNTRNAANTLAVRLEDKAFHMNREHRLELEDGETLGIASPVYFGGLPTIVREYLESFSMKVPEGTYVYFIFTYGRDSALASEQAEKLLGAKGIKIDAFYGIKTVDTYTFKSDLSDKAAVRKVLSGEISQIDAVEAHIRACDKGNFIADRKTGFFAKMEYSSYEKNRMTRYLQISSGCTGCRICVNNCPDKAIAMNKNRPVFIKEKCIMCLKCVHICPKFAIGYKSNARAHGQYIHP